MTVKQALLLAARDAWDMVYDPLGLHNEQSWYFIHAVLMVMKQYKAIRNFKVLKESDVQIESVPGRTY